MDINFDAITPEQWKSIRTRSAFLARTLGLSAEDLVQDAALTALATKDRYRGGSPACYLKAIMNNRAMNESTVLYGRGRKPGRLRLTEQYRTELRNSLWGSSKRTTAAGNKMYLTRSQAIG